MGHRGLVGWVGGLKSVRGVLLWYVCMGGVLKCRSLVCLGWRLDSYGDNGWVHWGELGLGGVL